MNNIIPMFKYFILTLKHKWFVLYKGCSGRLGGVSIIRLLLHDMTKLKPSELSQYGRQFFGKADDPEGFIFTWLKHQNKYKHHWEYWIPRTGHNRCDPPFKDLEPIPMDRVSVEEMVIDWLSAGRAYDGEWPVNGHWDWLHKNYPSIKENLHEDTISRLKFTLLLYGYERDVMIIDKGVMVK